jgi:hypothetical protein
MNSCTIKTSRQKFEGITGINYLDIDTAANQQSASKSYLMGPTSEFSRCFTHFHVPSGVRICRAATGWL